MQFSVWCISMALVWRSLVKQIWGSRYRKNKNVIQVDKSKVIQPERTLSYRKRLAKSNLTTTARAYTITALRTQGNRLESYPNSEKIISVVRQANFSLSSCNERVIVIVYRFERFPARIKVLAIRSCFLDNKRKGNATWIRSSLTFPTEITPYVSMNPP